MLDVVALSMALSVGQNAPALVPPPELPRNVAVPQVIPSGPVRMTTVPNQRSVISVDPMPTRVVVQGKDPMTIAADPKKDAAPMVVEEPKAEEATPEEPAEEPSKGLFMKAIEGTAFGQTLEERRISISGWTQMSYTGSNYNNRVNLPVVWNDRANEFLLQQHWMRFDKALDTESKSASFGWHVDAIFGSDYRFMLMRGLFNDQLLNSRANFNEPGGFTQNIYGFDLPQFYVNMYAPNLFEGTEFRVGRMYTPWGLESVEGPTSPLLSRSYAFNWCPPFFHMAVAALPKFNKNWSGVYMLANGNDVWIGDDAQEIRFVGATTWKSDDEKTSVTAATSFGRGKFNTGAPFNPATNGLQSEAAGRNNINVFDLVFTHKFNDCFSYGVEAIYGYQTGVPTTAMVGALTAAAVSDSPTSVTANWWSVAQYFNFQLNEKTSSVFRAEIFDDCDGQRTGYRGTYYAGTFGVQFKPKDWLWIRPEVRYDYNADSLPFDFQGDAGAGTKRDIFTFGSDLIIRW
jgi:hypothetical protein